MQKDATDIDMADLLNAHVISNAKKTRVTSASKKAETVANAPTAVFVISNDDIKRSGVTSVPEALRMAPGVEVARVNSNKWAVSLRGFNGVFANKLLVLIDGRSVYNPSFSGVYWDTQDVMLEDVDRIEVIRGPAATLWGANAVNGVINIISKEASKTQGGLLTAGGGSQENGFGALRYGKQLNQDTYGRVYINGFNRDNFKQADSGNSADDGWAKQQGGFRVDTRFSNQDDLTVQGDIYRTTIEQALTIPTLNPPFQENIQNNSNTSSGWNINSRFTHTFSTTAEYSLQFYYDHSRREDYLVPRQLLDTLNLDFQNSFRVNPEHTAIWGLGYRANLDVFESTPLIDITPNSRNTQLFTAFLQDEATLIDEELWLTIGSKFEHNDYSGFEGQPTAKLMWAPSLKQRFWASFSRAVRTPSRIEQNIHALQGVSLSPPIPLLGGQSLPVAIINNGTPNFRAEVELSYELGYRFTLSNQFSFDIAGFYNDYDNMRSYSVGNSYLSATPSLHLVQPVNFVNLGKASTYGFEAATVWQMTDRWRWDTNYSFLNTSVNNDLLSSTAISPQHSLSLRAVIDPVDDVTIDFWLRYTSSSSTLDLNNISPGARIQQLNPHVTFDTRLAWKLFPSLEISLVGQNLLDDRRLEFRDESGFVQPSAISRGVYGKLALEF
ncbi:MULTISPECIES: TonB-dependent receptor plug domain-containing protein [Methylomonas]|uniref:TonB-dependent receptor n=2 Tax=Methylomonas TaxID=416 RepID=A0A126T3S4_9GAMM|nr:MULTISPECIES: TonB-dependent receptor [Methylomonas]AMK76720.1 hypothetical protein JT25_009485 [Methylomonas denitrificans]OAI00035.1 hypothetical protein A1342_18600 [Methylomonas methanica]